MKFVALALGILATAFAFAVEHYFGALRQPLLSFLSDSGVQFLGLGLLYALAGAGLVAGLLALLSPLSGGLLLLAAACGWFGLGATIPDGFSVVVLVPLSLCLLGSIFGIIAAGDGSPAPALVEKEPSLVDAPRGPSLEELEREAALSRDLGSHFGELDIPEVTPAAEAADPEPTAALAPPADRRPPPRPSLLLVLMIANLALSAMLTLAVLLLYLEVRSGGL